MNRKLTAIALALAMAFCAVPMLSDDSSAAGDTYGVSLVEGTAYTYEPTYSLANVTTTLSGTAASWLSVTNGVISGTAPQVSASGTSAKYTLTITARTVNPTQTAVQNIEFTVYDTLTASVASSEDTFVGDTVSIQPTANFTGVTWSMTGAPSGLSMDASTGKITGTVSGTAGTHTATVTASHIASGQTATAQISFRVSAALNITSAADMYAVNGQALPQSGTDHYEAKSNIASGVTYSVTTGTLPSGVTMSSDGKFSGTPASMGETTVTITATETSTGQTDTLQLTVHTVAKLSFSSVPTGGIVVSPS